MCCNIECRDAMCGFEGKDSKIPLKREKKVPFTRFKTRNENWELSILKMKM